VPTQYSDKVWSGLEYPVAGLLLFEANVERALTMLADVRERHDGTRRSPWNEVECGDHYVRPMASWTLLEAASGFQDNAIQGSLAFAPRIDADDFRGFFITASGWGTFRQHTDAQLSLAYGQLSLNELRLDNRATRARVRVGTHAVAAESEHRDGRLRLRFDQPLALAAGDTVKVSFG
jgi:hypothetical protein